MNQTETKTQQQQFWYSEQDGHIDLYRQGDDGLLWVTRATAGTFGRDTQTILINLLTDYNLWSYELVKSAGIPSYGQGTLWLRDCAKVLLERGALVLTKIDEPLN